VEDTPPDVLEAQRKRYASLAIEHELGERSTGLRRALTFVKCKSTSSSSP
jgi:hypothetical protein